MYRKIRNTRDLREAYQTIKLINDCIKLKNDTCIDGFVRYIIEIKQEIRKYNHEVPCSRLVKDYGIDGYIELYELPNYDDIKDAREYFEECERICYTPSPYDCTGQAFTVWYKIFKRWGRTWVYHRVGFDV